MKTYFSIAVSLLGSIMWLSAQEPLSFVNAKMNEYRNRNLREKIYVHSDKDVYISGEIMWLKVYATEETTNRLLDASKVAYVEILDRDNRPVDQIKLSLREGQGSGSIQLPLTVNSGYYILRAYTAWMKNYTAAVFFEKPITIINPLKNAGGLETKVSFHVDFFPEGGNLVKDMESRVAFKITDQSGKGAQGTGLVVNQSNETVATFQTQRFGMGSFKLTPRTQQYTARVTLENGQTIEQRLPQVFDKGYVISVSQSPGENKIRVLVNGDKSSRDQVYLIAHSGTLVCVAEQASLNNGQAQFSIDRKKLAPGVSRFTIFNGQHQPVCERLVFNRPENLIGFDLQKNQQYYNSRQKVILDFTPRASATFNSDLSIAIYRIDSLQAFDESNLANYLLLSSDLTGTIESPHYYFRNADRSLAEDIDNLMLVHGWRRFKWDQIFENQTETLRFPIEYSGHSIAARFEEGNGKPLSNALVLLSVPDSKRKLFNAQTDAGGLARFEVKDFFDKGEIIFQALGKKVTTVIQSPFSEAVSSNTLPAFAISPRLKLVLEEYSIGMQAQNIYYSTERQKFTIPLVADSFPFYGKGVYSYNLDDYKRFTTMEEVLREYVTPIYVATRSGKLYPRIFNEERKEFDDENQLVMVNGIPLVDKTLIFSYDPFKFKRIDVIPKNFFLGSAVYSGLANFLTYEDNPADISLDPSLIKIDYEGLQKQREFYSPKYETQPEIQNRMPDLRTTLYWNPYLKLDKGKATSTFFTSDRKGTYVVVLQGVDSNGTIASDSFTFQVN